MTRTLTPAARSLSTATLPVCPVAPVITYIAPPHRCGPIRLLLSCYLRVLPFPAVSNYVLLAEHDRTQLRLGHAVPLVAVGSAGGSVLYFDAATAVHALHFRPM